MARRKDKQCGLLAEVPCPVGVVLGMGGLILCRAVLPEGLHALGGLVLGVGWLAALLSLAQSVERVSLLETRTGLESLKALSWRDF